MPGGYGDQAETRAKLTALRSSIAAAGVDAAYLEGWANVAWLFGGRGNRVVLDSALGQCGVLVTASSARLLVPNNEEARVRAEPFADLPLPVLVRPWHELPLWQSAVAQLPPGARVASDLPRPAELQAGGDTSDADAWTAVEPILAPLRQRLAEPDVARFRSLGRDAIEAMEAAVLEAREGWSELEVAGAIAAAMKSREIEATVILVGTRARAERFRHLVPTRAAIEGGLVASVTAVRHGLHASTTRTIAFGAIPGAIAEKHATAMAVDRAYLAHSTPGTTLGDAFRAGEREYAGGGFYDDWREHHQGGTTGYKGREVLGKPGSGYRLEAGMAVAWNPTVPGAKSEDTFLIAPDGLEWLTRAADSPWPIDERAGQVPRTGILVR